METTKKSRALSVWLGWLPTIIALLIALAVLKNIGKVPDWVIYVSAIYAVMHLAAILWLPGAVDGYKKSRRGLFFTLWACLGGIWLIGITLKALIQWIKSGGIGRLGKALLEQLATKQ